uniref:Uncharacterized protein n=1 Tax=Pipistrellus kuhlii TaxID=59472 RepID=A0A7J7UGD9_PIPKU|nr:hypothetical protein mPipKuh1_009059 [Pipistrellus kuhlii]
MFVIRVGLEYSGCKQCPLWGAWAVMPHAASALPPLKSGSYQVGSLMCPLGWQALGLDWKLLGDPSEKELPANVRTSLVCTSAFPARGPKHVAAFQIWKLRDSSAPGGKDSLPVLGRVGVGMFTNFISALEMLLLVCTVGELDLPLLQ